MRYDRDGFPILKRVTPKTTFSDVFITIRTLGFDFGKGPKRDVIRLSKTIKDDELRPEWESHYVTMDDLPEFLNYQMEEGNFIKKKEPEL